MRTGMLTMNPPLTSENISTHQGTRQAWFVCFAAALFFFYEFIQMNMFNAISSDLMRDFSIKATELGKLSAIYFYASVLFLPIAGTLLDRFSTRRIILITILLCTVGIASFALTHSMSWAYVFRFISGIGNAFCFLSSIRLASRWFPTKQMALVTGAIVTMAMTGGLVAQTPLTLLTEWLGWRHALLLDAALGLIITGIIWMVVRDYPSELHAEQHTSRSELQNIGLVQSLLAAYSNRQNWFCGIYTSLMNLPIALFGAIWGNLYLTQVQHLSAIQASYVITALFVGTLIGGPVVGKISDYISLRRSPMIAGAVFSLITIFIIIHVPNLNLLAYLILFFVLGFITSTQVISYPLAAENNPKIITATSVSVVSFSALAGYAIFQPLFGWLMDLHWSGAMVDNVRIYNAHDYFLALLIIPIGFAIALLASLLLRESHCQRKE